MGTLDRDDAGFGRTGGDSGRADDDGGGGKIPGEDVLLDGGGDNTGNEPKLSTAICDGCVGRGAGGGDVVLLNWLFVTGVVLRVGVVAENFKLEPEAVRECVVWFSPKTLVRPLGCLDKGDGVAGFENEDIDDGESGGGSDGGETARLDGPTELVAGLFSSCFESTRLCKSSKTPKWFTVTACPFGGTGGWSNRDKEEELPKAVELPLATGFIIGGGANGGGNFVGNAGAEIMDARAFN